MVDRSTAYGEAVAAHILAWARSDGGAVIENMGFPLDYTPGTARRTGCRPARSASSRRPSCPTGARNRPFAMPSAGPADPGPHRRPTSEDPESDFFTAAKEVYDTGNNLTDEQKLSRGSGRTTRC
jgi:hypothetical protein